MSYILEVSNLNKAYHTKEVLHDVSFNIEKGQIVGLLGPNGSGKTTLIKIINCLITDFTGNVRVCGESLGVRSKQIISYLPDVDYLPREMRASNAIAFFSDFYKDFDPSKAREMLRLVGVNENQLIKTLSKGMTEKLKLVLVMSRKAKLYIFDEPIAGVDPAARDFILNTIIKNYNEDGAVLFSTHLISDVEGVMSRAIFIRDGRIIIDGDVDILREEKGMSIDKIFREEYKC